MSLADIQAVVLRMSVDPQFAASVYQQTAGLEEKVQEARLIPQQAIESFQMEVAIKRIRKPLKSVSLLSGPKRTALLRSFITEHVIIVESEWADKIPAFLQHIAANLGDSIEEQVIKEMAVFESWARRTAASEQEEQAVADGYHIGPHVQVGTFQLPADCLISDEMLPMQRLVEEYGTPSYLLAMHNEDEAELFEIDALYYEFLTQARTLHTYEELLNVADKLLVQFEMTDKRPAEMMDELQELGILIQNRQEAVSWQGE